MIKINDIIQINSISSSYHEQMGEVVDVSANKMASVKLSKCGKIILVPTNLCRKTKNVQNTL